MQSKRPRETPTDLEHMENDELRRMGTSSTAIKRKSDQPEEATVKEQRVDVIMMDEGPRDAGVTKMRMDEMLTDQVMAVSSGTSRVCVNEEKYEPATIRGLPTDLLNCSCFLHVSTRVRRDKPEPKKYLRKVFDVSVDQVVVSVVSNAQTASKEITSASELLSMKLAQKIVTCFMADVTILSVFSSVMKVADWSG